MTGMGGGDYAAACPLAASGFLCSYLQYEPGAVFDLFPGKKVAKYHFVKYFMKMDFFCSGKRVNSRILRMGFDL